MYTLLLSCWWDESNVSSGEHVLHHMGMYGWIYDSCACVMSSVHHMQHRMRVSINASTR